ncbi:MAG: hypothetical protein ACLPVY_25575 [Acidimicrobiia bacterium]
MTTWNSAAAASGQIFDDPTVAVATLDRLLRRSVVFNMGGGAETGSDQRDLESCCSLMATQRCHGSRMARIGTKVVG